MNIGTVAERSGVSPKAIRYYESIGLVRPAERRPNGYRSYSLVDMRTLDFIKRARSLGFSVEAVRELLDLWQNRSRRSAAVKALTSRHLEALDRKIEELTIIRKALADLVKRCRGDARPDCPILDDFAHGEQVPHKAASPVEHRPKSRRHKEKS
jgi:MerR family transcriptional regulator, copper efflux regulator